MFHLEPGEQLLWSGAPQRGVRLRPSDWLAIPTSLLWLWFVVFREKTVVNEGAPLGFRIFGLLFVLIGLYITVGRFFYDASRRRGTTYGITSNRVIIATTGQFGDQRSLRLETLTDLGLVERPDRSGTIRFAKPGRTRDWLAHRWMGVPEAGTFDMIPDARRVYRPAGGARRAQG